MIETMRERIAALQSYESAWADATLAVREFAKVCGYLGLPRIYLGCRERRHSPATLRRRGARGRARVVRDAIRNRGVAL